MARPRAAGELEIEQDKRFEKKELTAERIGWGLMLLIIVAALLGLFGSGPLSGATARTADGSFSLQYQRFARYGAPADFSFTLDPAAVPAGRVQLWINREFLRHYELQGITPQPDRVNVKGDRLVYTFATGGAAGPFVVVFSTQARAVGRVAGTAGFSAGEQRGPGRGQLRFNQFIYP